MRHYLNIFNYLKPMRARYFAALILSSCELIMLFSAPIVNRMLMEMIVDGSGSDTLMQVILIMAGLLGLTPLIALGNYWQRLYAQQASNNLKITLFQHIQKLSLQTLHKRQTSDYLMRLSQEADTVGNTLLTGFVVSAFMRFVVVTPVTMALLWFTDWRMAVLAIVYSLICLPLSLFLNPYVQKLEREARIEIAASSNIILETMRSLPIVKVFMMGTALESLYHRRCMAVRKKRAKFRAVNGISYGVMDFFSFSAQAVGFMLAIYLLIQDETGLSEAVYMASLMSLVSDGLLSFSTFVLWSQPGIVAAKRIFEVLDEPGEAAICTDVQPNEHAAEAFSLNNISFAYPNGDLVLNGINISVPRGQKLALVGGSGGGKSTLAKIIAFLYEPSKGEITFYGFNRQQLNLEDIRKFIAYVPQEIVLFEGSIYENIALGKSNATADEIITAAKDANLHQFVTSLPEGYDTKVGENGTKLSGGQRQRIAIARAFLKDAPLLILDEASSALDSDTESQIQHSLEKLSKGRTTVTVAHRLSTIYNADRILVLEKGVVVEQGTHSTLIEQGGRYSKLALGFK